MFSYLCICLSVLKNSYLVFHSTTLKYQINQWYFFKLDRKNDLVIVRRRFMRHETQFKHVLKKIVLT